jgi:hypothetical protein
MVLQPFFEPSEVPTKVTGVGLSEAEIASRLTGLLAGLASAGLLPFPDPGIRPEGSTTKRAFLFFHLGPPQKQRNEPVQRNYKTKMIQKNRIIFLYRRGIRRIRGGNYKSLKKGSA